MYSKYNFLLAPFSVFFIFLFQFLFVVIIIILIIFSLSH